MRIALPTFLFAFVLVFFTFAAGHADDLALSPAALEMSGEGAVLEIGIRYPSDDEPLALQAVSTGGRALELQQRTENGYVGVESIPVNGPVALGEDTSYRAVLRDPASDGLREPITLLFGGGALLTVAQQVPPAFPRWLVVVLLVSASISLGGRVAWFYVTRRSKHLAR